MAVSKRPVQAILFDLFSQLCLLMGYRLKVLEVQKLEDGVEFWPDDRVKDLVALTSTLYDAFKQEEVSPKATEVIRIDKPTYRLLLLLKTYFGIVNPFVPPMRWVVFQAVQALWKNNEKGLSAWIEASAKLRG